MSRLSGKLAIIVRLIFVITILLIIESSSRFVPRASAQGSVARGPFIDRVVSPKSMDVDLRRLPNIVPPGPPQVFPLRGRGQSTPSHSVLPPSEFSPQLGMPPSKMPAPSQNFPGIGFTFAGWPPDPNGDVSPNYYFQAVNTSIALYTKTGTLLAGPTSFNSFWAGTNTGTPCDSQHHGDPIILYDQLADRWLVTDFAFAADFFTGTPQPPYYQCIAITKTGNPLVGGWNLYPILADPNLLNDYSKFGLWHDAYYMTANMYDISTNAFFVRAWALDRNAMLAGTQLNSVHFDLPVCAPTDAVCPYASLLPSNLRGSLPPAGAPNYLANIEAANLPGALPFSSNVLHLWKFHVDWNNLMNSTFTDPINLPVNTFTQPLTSSGNTITMNLVPQKGTATQLDTIGDRLMMQAQYRNLVSTNTQSLWLTHTINHGNVTAIRWYEIQINGNSFSLAQQGTFDPGDGNYRWLPSLAVDANGNMAVGYSVSGTNLNPSIRYAGRLQTDPPNQLSQGEATLIDGTGSQTDFILTGPITRWGDYSAMTVDPSDDCTFWYTNEYYAADGYTWQTRIGSYKFSSCGATPPTNSYYFPFIGK